VLGRCGARSVVRHGERGGDLERARQPVRVERVDENAAAVRDELRRPADARRDDRLATGEPFEERLPERLDERRATHDVGCAEPGRDVVV
jgi:hypothetical protein